IGGRLRRNWIARTASSLPNDETLSEVQRAVEEDAFIKIREAYSSAATLQQLSEARPTVTLVRLDEHHLIVRVEFAEPAKSVGDTAAISQWGVLQLLDRRFRLDDLQGIPCEHWFPLRAAREAP